MVPAFVARIFVERKYNFDKRIQLNNVLRNLLEKFTIKYHLPKLIKANSH